LRKCYVDDSRGFDKSDPGRIYIKGYIYIPYPIQKSGKRIFSYPFFEWDMLKDIYPYFRDLHIFISYPISFLQYKFELCCGFFSFGQCSFCLHLLWGEIVNRYLQKKPLYICCRFMFCSQFTFLKESCILNIFKIKIDSTNFVFLMLK
jgi:hypothetical protein